MPDSGEEGRRGYSNPLEERDRCESRIENLQRELEEPGLTGKRRLELKRAIYFERVKLEPGRVPAEGDLEIRVRVEPAGSDVRFHYELHSPNRKIGLYRREVRGPRFRKGPQEYWQYLAKKIENLHQRLDVDGTLLTAAEATEKIDGIGRELYRHLFPPEMRALYRQFRDARSIHIRSDEPWIPWEMIRPFDLEHSSEGIDDDFFGAQFQVTRWLGGTKPPPPEVRVRRIACLDGGLIPGMPLLEYTSKEIAMVAEKAGEDVEVETLGSSEVTSTAMRAILDRGDTEMVHFAGHGEFYSGSPDESGIELVDGRTFRCVDLQGALLQSVSKVRPWVFFNACRAGRQGASLSGIGGWVDRWVRQAGCGGFVSPQWAVEDRLAHEFAERFYSSLKASATFGEAALRARRHVRELAPESPAWLAFAVYAHPEGRLKF